MKGAGRRHCLHGLAGLGLLTSAGLGRAAAPLQWQEVKALVRRRYPAVLQLSVPELQAWLQDGARPRPLVLDTRTAEEFADGHLAGAVRVDSVGPAIEQLRQRPAGVAAVLYCSVGYRSSALADELRKRGVAQVYNLEGSIFEWANSGHAVVASQGVSGRVHPYDRKWGVLLRRDLWSREP